MTLWQFSSALGGWMDAQGVQSKPDMLDDSMIDEFERMAGHA